MVRGPEPGAGAGAGAGAGLGLGNWQEKSMETQLRCCWPAAAGAGDAAPLP